MRLLLVAAMLGAVSAPARSDSLPAASTAVTCTDVTVVNATSNCANGGASATLTLLPFAGAQVQAFAPASDPATGTIFGAGATADIQYSFEVLGGTSGDLVPVVFAANLSASASSVGHANGFSSIFVHTSEGDTQVCVMTNGFGCPTGAFSGSFSVQARSGSLGTVNLEVSADAGDSLSPESANASIDPSIFIDPKFPDAGAYSIQLSPGVGNGVPVPEPGPGALMIGGLAALGGLLRRRGNPPSRLSR